MQNIMLWSIPTHNAFSCVDYWFVILKNFVYCTISVTSYVKWGGGGRGGGHYLM